MVGEREEDIILWTEMSSRRVWVWSEQLGESDYEVRSEQ